MDISLKKDKIAVTVCALNYLGKALVLRNSYLRTHPDSDFMVLLMDRKSPEKVTGIPEVMIKWVEDLGIPGFQHYAFKFDVIELSTNVKPTILRQLLGDYGVVLYIDPDIEVFEYLTPVFEALEKHSIVVTPHATSPVLDGNNPSDIDFSRFGSFNLGFIGLSKCEESLSFLDWWSERCLSLGFYEPQLGLAVDQKWIDLAPCYFPGLFILRHLGLNVAFWNLHERRLSLREGKWLVNESVPLHFYHFSSFSPKDPTAIAHKQSRWASGSRPDCDPLMNHYAELLSGQDNAHYSGYRYSFDVFHNGAYISPTLRRVYAALEARFPADDDPFSADSAFYRFATKHHLVSNKMKPAPRETFKDMHRYTWPIRAINFGLSTCLRILGPNRYFTLMKYLSHISSIRNQADLF